MRYLRLSIILLLSLAILLTSCARQLPDHVLPDTPDQSSASFENDQVTKSPETQIETEDETASDPYEIVEVEKPDTDPYTSVTNEEFYANYTPATDYWDAYYRSLHGFMSGSLEKQDQNPTISENRPMENGMYLKNTSDLYSYDGHAYTVLDSNGDIAYTVYEGGGYITLEEVAAYVFAFGDIPANYTSAKNGSPSSSPWGEYLRLNHSAFSGSTTKYPYEPALPFISGCGGPLSYYEIDIGTTGTDCDPSYVAALYNDGKRITRGAARIVYSRFDANHNQIIDVNEKFVFYTNNHYNDFREYLNYEGGWGEIFGNITGGGSISSKSNYNPTPYVAVMNQDFRELTKNTVSVVIPYIQIIYDKSKYYFNY